MHTPFEAVTSHWGIDPKPREIQLEPKDVQEEVYCRISCLKKKERKETKKQTKGKVSIHRKHCIGIRTI